MRYLILFCALLVTMPAQAQDRRKAPTPIRAMLEFCLPALVKGEAPADVATIAKLPEFPAEQAIKFSPDGGRVFAIPYDLGNLALTTSKAFNRVCSIAVRETKVAEFWPAIDQWFGPTTPFKLVREKRMDDERMTRREYKALIGGQTIGLIVSASDVARKDGMQALMTAARIKKDSPAP